MDSTEAGGLMVDTSSLTKRQKEIFEYVKSYARDHGYPPTVRDIGKAIGLTSSSTVHAHLANLEKAGVLKRDPTKPRAIEVLVDRAKAVVTPNGLPLVGQVAAGQPILADQNIEEYVPVPQIAGGDEGEFVLRVKGDSMKNAGIFDEDYVVVRPQKTATNGEIVVAMMEGRRPSSGSSRKRSAYVSSRRTTSWSRSTRATWTSWAAS